MLSVSVLLMAHVGTKQPLSSSTNLKKSSHFSLDNVQVTRDYEYCFMDVVVKWPGSIHDAHVFTNWAVNACGTVEKSLQEAPIPFYILGEPDYPLLAFLIKRIC